MSASDKNNPVSGKPARTRTITSTAFSTSEKENSSCQNFQSELDELRIKVSKLENEDITRQTNIEACVVNTAKVNQLLTETTELREAIDLLRSKISHLESVEGSLASAIQEIKESLHEQASDNRESSSCDVEGPTTGEIIGEEEEGGVVPVNNTHRNEAEEVLEDETLPHDTFSFMILSPPFTLPLVLSMIVFFFQITAFSLVASSIIEMEDSKNPFSIPANVTSTVRFTQIVAIVIAIITQDDMRTGLNLFLEGHDNEQICKSFPALNRRKWNLSIIARLMEGSLSLLVTFLLIMTVETVIDLLLNFTAMAFVSQLDEVCFFMCRQGFFGKTNAITAKKIASTRFHRRDDGGKGHIRRSIFLIVLSVALFAGWFTIAHNQNSGKYLCSTLFVQFADEVSPVLGTYSGLYDQRSSGWAFFSGRDFEYADRRSGNGVLSFCEELGAWTFTTIDKNPCDWLARSEETSTFDLLETASLTWIVRNSISREAILEPFFFSCYECDGVVTSAGYHSRCSGRGYCENAVCSCNDGWYGLRCEFREPCQTLEFDSRFGPFQGNHRWSSVFSRFELNNEFVDTYLGPVYVNEYSPGLFDILVYMGRRWVATYSGLLPIAHNASEGAKEALATYFYEHFHPSSVANFAVALVSEPVDVGTSLDITSPIGLEWYAFTTLALDPELLSDTTESTLIPIPSKLLCAVCNNTTNACLYDGTCINGRCYCSIGSSGALCQIPPVGNGHCDLFYNTLEFEYDGGDCCESTCVSSGQFACGRDESGFVDLGYFFCHLPAEGWRANGETIMGETHSGFGHAIKLSGNRKIIAVAEPGLDRVLLFDKVGSQWIQRGRSMEGQPGTLFGASIAMSSGPLNMFSNPFAMVPVMIAVGNSYYNTVYISLFDCSGSICLKVVDDLVAIQSESPLLGVIDMSNDGGIVVAGARPAPSQDSMSFPYPLALFRRDIYGGDWIRQKVNMAFRDSEGVYSVALSASGDVLAVASFEANFTPGGVLWVVNNTRRVYVGQGTFWTQRGSSIMEEFPHRSLLFDLQGQSMDLSSDGNVVAVGLYKQDENRGTYTRVFAWDDSESDWMERGSPLSCGDMELQGVSLSLSSDGAVVAISAADYSGVEGFTPNRVGKGATCSFGWDGTDWRPLGNPFPGAVFSSVALSPQGSDLAISQPRQVSVYTSPQIDCRNGSSLLRLSITTDATPDSTTWSVSSNQTGEILLQGGPYSIDEHIFASFVEETCFGRDDCLIFTIYDSLDLNGPSESNGINPPGGYALFLDGEELPSGNFTRAVERIHIGNCMTCPNGTRLFRMLIQTCVPIAWKLVGSSGEALFFKNSFDKYFHRFHNSCAFSNQTTYWEDACVSLDDDCYHFSVLAPPVKVVESTSGWNGTTVTRPLHPNLRFRLFLDDDEIASNTSQVFVGREQNESVAFVPFGKCVRY